MSNFQLLEEFLLFNSNTWWSIENQIFYLFCQYPELTFSQILVHLKQKKVSVSEETVYQVLQFLFIPRGYLIRKDYWEKEPVYELVDKYRRDSSFTKHYYSFQETSPNHHMFIALADTHIGDEEIENIKLLDALYNYGIQLGIKNFFHIGDLFTKKGVNDVYQLLKKFHYEYPHPYPNELMTYGVLGNHDKKINEVLKEGYPYLDLRLLSALCPSFYMFPREKWIAEVSNITINFSHKLFVNVFVPDLILSDIYEIQEFEKLFGCTHDVLISGHLHQGIVYTGYDKYKKQECLYLGVPSTSNINLNHTVAYLVNLQLGNDKNVKEIHTIPLKCDENYKITPEAEIPFYFHQKNKVYRKVL